MLCRRWLAVANDRCVVVGCSDDLPPPSPPAEKATTSKSKPFSQTARGGKSPQPKARASPSARWKRGIIPHCMNDPRPEGHMASHIGRRKFLATLGGAAAAWPLAARAQQGERVRRIGLSQTASWDDAEYQARVGALLQELQQLGWMIGRNIRIDTRWTKGDPDDARKYAAELVALAPDAIVATGISTVGPLLQLTRTIPIVFPAASDPVA